MKMTSNTVVIIVSDTATGQTSTAVYGGIVAISNTADSTDDTSSWWGNAPYSRSSILEDIKDAIKAEHAQRAWRRPPLPTPPRVLRARVAAVRSPHRRVTFDCRRIRKRV